jgi:ABC-2 type transport system permease protein
MSFANIFSKRNRALLHELVVTDFKLRYQGSVLGYAWSLLRPLMIFLILYVVFVKFLRIGADVPHFPVYLLLGIVIWNFFAEMTSQSLGSIVGRGDLIRKIRIPRWIIVMSSSISALINLVLNLLVVAVFMILNHVELTASALWLPAILLEVYVFALGLSLFLAALFVKYRDISYIWEVVLQGMFYLTPILYPISLITNETFRQLLFMNPMAQSIQAAREAVVTPATITIQESFKASAFPFEIVPFIITILALIGGVSYFRKRAGYFAEDI